MIIPWHYKALGAAGLFLAYSGGLAWWSYDAGWDKREAAVVASELAETKAVLTGFENQVLAMNGLAGQYTQIAQGLSTEIDALSGRFRNAVRAAPLDVTCKPDPVRVQFLSEAISATNSAIGRGAGPAVPPAP
jgi:hypothetical protein